jgi:hypothetical protein
MTENKIDRTTRLHTVAVEAVWEGPAAKEEFRAALSDDRELSKELTDHYLDKLAERFFHRLKDNRTGRNFDKTFSRYWDKLVARYLNEVRKDIINEKLPPTGRKT